MRTRRSFGCHYYYYYYYYYCIIAIDTLVSLFVYCNIVYNMITFKLKLNLKLIRF